jgi:hypothetical protein
MAQENSWLLKSVASAIGSSPMGSHNEARAAVRAVIEWLQSKRNHHANVWAMHLEKELNQETKQ